MKKFVKRIVFAIGGSEPVLARRIEATRRAGVITILNMHRVAQPDGSDYRPLDPAIFESVIQFLIKYFEVVTFAGAREYDGKKPIAILSFDDGYKDFIDCAVPILHKYGVICNQNVIPACVENGLPPLNVLAQDFVGKAPSELVNRLEVPGFRKRVRKQDGAQLSRFLKSRSHASQVAIADQLIPQFFAWQEFRPTRMMSRKDVTDIAGVHEIGAHSYSHASMEYESIDFLREDVRRCRDYFHNALNMPMDIYAFPNGSCSDEHIQAVVGEGVRDVLLVGESFDRGGGVRNRFTFDGLSHSEARFKSVGGFARVNQ